MLVDKEISQKLWEILKICIVVAKSLGKGRTECVYQNAILYELRKKYIQYNTEETIPILHDNISVGFERLDIISFY